ncbi:hypothetical protein Tco_0827241 [Tanacetum coccineum]
MSPSQDLRGGVSYATPPPDTKARVSPASLFPKCHKRCTATVTQILKDLSARSRIQLIPFDTDPYLNKLSKALQYPTDKSQRDEPGHSTQRHYNTPQTKVKGTSQGIASNGITIPHRQKSKGRARAYHPTTLQYLTNKSQRDESGHNTQRHYIPHRPKG